MSDWIRFRSYPLCCPSDCWDAGSDIPLVTLMILLHSMEIFHPYLLLQFDSNLNVSGYPVLLEKGF